MIVRFVRPVKFEELTGYTVKAVEKKIETRVWLEGFEYIVAPDGNRLVDLEGFERWAQGQRHAPPRRP